jgi:hypothetical protein
VYLAGALFALLAEMFFRRDQHFAQAFLAYAELRTNRLSWLECPARMTARQRERGEIEINAVQNEADSIADVGCCPSYTLVAVCARSGDGDRYFALPGHDQLGPGGG